MQTNRFADLPPTPSAHFQLYFYAAVLRVIDRVCDALGSSEAVFERFPFLVGYNNALAACGVDGLSSADAAGYWYESLRAWEEAVPGHLPLRALREVAGLDHAALTLLVSIGLGEEDARFGALYEIVQGIPGQRRPTAG